MSRKTGIWVGKTDDTPPPPRVRMRVFERFGGVCQLSGRKIGPADKWELDHRTALINGGANDETNLQPVLASEHRKKTAQDVAQKAKDRRVRQKHLGIAPKKQKMPYRRFNGEIVYPD